MDATAASARVLEYRVEPLSKTAGESDTDAAKRILGELAGLGWEIVDSCGDEVGKPVLIFQKRKYGTPNPDYRVEEIPHARGEDEIREVSEKIWQLKEEGWLPECILDSPVSNPVGIFSKSTRPTEPVLVKVVVVAVGMFEKTTEMIVNELLDQQVRNNFSVTCIMHGGLNPVLVLQSKELDKPYEYLVEHAKGGIFSNTTTKLTDLISTRADEGWEVCGAFEDSFLWPCVVFRRPTDEVPVVSREIVAEVEKDRAAQAELAELTEQAELAREAATPEPSAETGNE
jgi:hypothetical protein